MEAATGDKNNSKTTEREKIGAFGKIMCNLFNLCSFFGNLSVTEEHKKHVDKLCGGISSAQSNDKKY